MPIIAAVVGGGLGLLGSSMAADTAAGAAESSSAAQLEAARIAADAAKFRPYAVSTGFGRGYFGEAAPQTSTGGGGGGVFGGLGGAISSALQASGAIPSPEPIRTAGYEISPELQAMRDRYYALGQQALGGVELDPTKAAEAYYAQQQGLLAPTRTAQDIALRQQQLQGGRVGYGISGEAAGAGMGTGMVNPEQYQRDLARAQIDAQLAAQSRQQAMNEIDAAIARGTGLLSSGFGVEELAMKPLLIGADIGNKAAVSQGQQAQALLAGGQGAAQTNLAAGLGQAQMQQNMFNQLANQNWGGLFSGGTPNFINNMMQGYTTNPMYGGQGYGTGYTGVF